MSVSALVDDVQKMHRELDATAWQLSKTKGQMKELDTSLATIGSGKRVFPDLSEMVGKHDHR